MESKKTNLIGLAKGKKTTASKKPITTKKTHTKKVVVKPVEKVLTKEEERDLKAKARVEKLLEGTQLTVDKKEVIVVDDETPNEFPTETKGIDWLEEQMTLVTSENDVLRLENEQLRDGTFSNDGEVKSAVVRLFDELQTNHIKMGTDPQSGVGNFRIYNPGFLNRMIKFFPFLSDYKQY